MASRPPMRRRVLTLSGSAAVLACAVTLAPMFPVTGSGGDGATVAGSKAPAFLTAAEPGAFTHNAAHLRATREARGAARRQSRLCARPGYRTANPLLCPAPAPSLTQAALARSAGAQVSALGPTEADGLWGPLLSIPSTAIHAVVLPTNRVLFISQPKYPTELETDGGNAYVWDPATNTSTSVPPPVVDYPTGPDRPANLWCGGQATLADGRVLVVGGNLEYPLNNGIGAGNGFKGAPWVMTFDPWTETWTRHADMPHGRWYPTVTQLPDGRALIVGGWDETGGVQGPGGPGDAPTMVNDQDVEVFDPATDTVSVVSQLPPNGAGQPQPWPDHQGIGLYPHMFVLPDTTVAGAGGDKVLVVGPGKYDSAIIDTGSWIWTDVVDLPDSGQPRLSSDRSWGRAWMEPTGPDGSRRVVIAGGVDAGVAVPGQPGDSPAPLTTAEVLDLDDPTAGWTIDPALEMNTGRGHFNSVQLPDGTILANGGGYGRKNGSLYAEPVYGSELYTPGAGWREVGDEADARTYHSTAVLLPDGRVASAGDDRDIAPDHIPLAGRTAQLWSPPYLFDGPRPQVTFAPTTARYDAPVRIAVQGDPAAVTAAVLIRPAAVTHSVDMSQRLVPLQISAQADGLTLQTPANATIAPPGWYMLFVLNADGVPSAASWIDLDPDAPDAPALPVAPPPAVAPDATPPAPAPPGTPAVGRLRVTVPRPAVRRAGARVRVTVTLRANRAAGARLVVRRGARALSARTFALPAGRTVRRTIVLGPARVGTARALRVGVTVRDTAGGRVIVNRIAEVPARR